MASADIDDGVKKLWGGFKSSEFIQCASMNEFMPQWKFENIKHYIPHMWKYETRKDSDPCWELISAFEYFNNNWINTVTDSVWKVFNEFMSIFHP